MDSTRTVYNTTKQCLVVVVVTTLAFFIYRIQRNTVRWTTVVFEKADVTKTAFLDEWPHTVIEVVTSPLGQHVRLENVCLQVYGRSRDPILWTNFPPSFKMTRTMNQLIGKLQLNPSMTGILPPRNIYAIKRNRLIIESVPSHTEWIQDEHLLVHRTITPYNLFHWMQHAFFVYAAFPTSSNSSSTPTKRVFHVPTNTPFWRLADLSYAEFLHLVGVREQRTIHGPITNLSLRHFDEMSSEDDNVTQRWTCFSKALLGLVSTPYLGSWTLDGPFQQSYQSMVSNIINNLDINPQTASSFCPSEVTFILRYKESNTTRTGRRLENWPEVENELRARNISYNAVDIETEKELQSFRAQVQLALCQGLLVAAHGQALWLTYFVPSTAAVIEILPYGFYYHGAYKNIATTNGVLTYDEMSVETPFPVVEADQFKNIEKQLRNKNYNESQIENVRNSLIPLLRPKSFDLLTKYFQSLDLADPEVMATEVAREQRLVVNVKKLVDRIENILLVR